MTKPVRRELQGKTIVAVRLPCHPKEHDRFRTFWLELDSENMGNFGQCGITDGLHKYCNLSFDLLIEAPTFPANRSGACNHGLAVSEPTQPAIMDSYQSQHFTRSKLIRDFRSCGASLVILSFVSFISAKGKSTPRTP